MAEEKQHKKRIFLFNPLKRPLPYIGLLLALVLLIFQQTIRNYVSDTIGEIVVNSMKEATGGMYKTTYDIVRFDIFTKELRISKLKIELDTTVISREEYLQKRPNLIHINTPIIVVKLRSFLPLLLKKQLYVSYVGAKNPQFNLVKSTHNSIKKDETEKSKEDFREVINTYFAALEVDSFYVEKGSFSISNHGNNEEEVDLIHIGEFTTMLKHFRLDSLSPSKLLKGIRAQSFDLEVIDQDVNLPNLNQKIHFNRLSLSTTDSTFVLDSLKIENIRKIPGKDLSELSIKKLEILGFNFDKAFTNNELFVNEVHIVKPKVYYKKVNFASKKSSQQANINSFYDYFQELNINSIKLFDGSINYEAKRKTSIENINLSVSDYSINPADWSKKKAISDFTLNLFSAKGITQELPDSIHIATINDITYTGLNRKLLLNKLKIKPISGRNTYATLKSRNTNFSASSTINSITLTSFIPEELVIENMLKIDSVIIDKPKGSIVQYPAMYIAKKSSSSPTKIKLKVNHFITNNGSFKLRSYQNKVNQITQLNGIYITSSAISHQVFDKKFPATYKLLIKNGSTQLKDIGHSVSFSNLSFNQTNTVFIEHAKLMPDSTTLPYSRFNADLKDVIIEGIDLAALKKQQINIDSILIGSLNSSSFISENKLAKNTNKKKNKINTINIGSFLVQKSTIDLNQKGVFVKLDNTSLRVRNLQVDSIQQALKPTINFDSTVLNMGHLSFNNPAKDLKITLHNGLYNEAQSTFIANQFALIAKKNDLEFRLEQLGITGFNKQRLLLRKELAIAKLTLTNPVLKLQAITQKDSTKLPLDIHKAILKGGLTSIAIDSLQIIGARASLALPNTKHAGFNSFKGIATKYHLDTLTTLYDAINDFKGTFEFADIYLKGLTDTLSISKLHINTYQRFVWTDSLFFKATLKKNNISIASPGIAIDHINIPKLLENKIEISRISSRNNTIELTQTDTTKSSKKPIISAIKLPLNLSIGDINLVNTHFSYTKINHPNHLLSHLNFDIKLDSLEAVKDRPFDIAKQTHDSKLKVYDFSFNLPDSLNTIGFDTLIISTKKSQIDVANLALTARYPKYKYGNQVGYQVDWKDLLFKKVQLENINFIELIENKTFKCQKITLTDGYLKLFKDKQLPFPSDRVVPILQERVKGIKAPIKIDSVEIKNFDIYQSTLQSTGLQEGGISFINTDGLITNITNDSLRLANNRMLEVTASTKIMGSGNLFAEFKFDMLDKDNLFFFDARLGSMDAKAFNNILEAAAFVKVKSGVVRSLNLHATGNKSYAYGDMSFIYSNLKVETINKKTLENKGMGKVLKTFFANAFVVKKNNSRIKFITRRGGMYYERDISRITLDYMAKTALSGVVSSIGAKSNQKQIKQIAKDNKAARDLELKQQKELDKAAKKKAKKEK